MTEQPKTVVCTSCSAKFLVPDELIRGKLVKFRCRKCGSVIEADGRKSAKALATAEPRTTEITAVDTPATFSQRTVPPPPPPPPPASVSNNTAHLHPWPEPPRPLSTAPTSISDSSPPEPLPRAQPMRDPSNRGPKIAAIVALLVAAGLSGVGLAMRSSPPGAAAGDTAGLESMTRPYVPPGVDPAARPAAEARRDDPNRLNRSPTRVTDLPRAAAGTVEEPATAGGTIAVAKPSETTIEKQEPTADRQAVNVAPTANAASVAPVAAPAAPIATEVPVAAAGTEPPAAGTAPGATANAGAAAPPENGAAAVNAAPVVGVNPSSLPIAPPPAARAKGDFNTQSAREALEDAAVRANKCKTIDTPSGNGRVAVTFAPNGHVTNAVIDSGPLVGTAAGTCVASKFRSAKVPAFSGESVVVRKNVKF